MATPADNQKQIDSLEAQIQQIRNTKYRDEPFAAKNDPEIKGLRAQQTALKNQNLVTAPNNPATDAYVGVDPNSGQGRYTNTQTGVDYLGPPKETPQTQVTTQANAENIAEATAKGDQGSVTNTTVSGTGENNTLSQVNTQTNQTAQPNSSAGQTQGSNAPVDADVNPQANQFVFDANGELVPGDSAQAEAIRNPVDHSTQAIDPYTAIGDRELDEEELQARDNPIDYSNEVEVDPYSDVEGDYGAREEGTGDDVVEVGPDGSLTARAQIQAEAETLRQAQALQQLRAKSTNEDWRFRIRLAPNSNYLYRDQSPGILQPLMGTNGVVFPYTPQISTNYRANYDPYELVHTNYKGYFYKNSAVEEFNVQGVFTANSASEADYLLAVIHFFRSASKMFYGQDSNPTAGTPPPVLFMDGLGVYQFNEHPCLLTSFNYSLPSDVDYIRAGGARNYSGGAVNLSSIRNQQGAASNSPLAATLSRLTSLKNAFDNFINPGARANNPLAANTTNYYGIAGQPTYVPTKINIAVTLLPLISRQQQAQAFSLKDYATGAGLRDKGFY